MATVYEVKSGKPLNCEAVDARELIASGAYRATEEAEKPERKSRKKAEKPEPEA